MITHTAARWPSVALLVAAAVPSPTPSTRPYPNTAYGTPWQTRADGTFPTNVWRLAAGPWIATNGQARMEWTDSTNAPGGRRFYRVEAQTP